MHVYLFLLLFALDHEQVVTFTELLQLHLFGELMMLLVILDEVFYLIFKLLDSRLFLHLFFLTILHLFFLFILAHLQVSDLVDFIIGHPDGGLDLL